MICNDSLTNEQLLILRRRNKLTQDEMSKVVGLSRLKYASLENSEREIADLLSYNQFVKFVEGLNSLCIQLED